MHRGQKSGGCGDWAAVCSHRGGEELCRLKEMSTSGVKWLQMGRLDTRRWFLPAKQGMATASVS